MGNSPSIASILSRGYFPKELPPTFTSAQFGEYVQTFKKGKIPFDTSDAARRTSRPEVFNLARAGSLRRELSILNPIHYTRLTEYVVDNWDELIGRVNSKYSLTVPTLSETGRAIVRGHSLEDLPRERAKARSQGTHLMHADVSRFYPSIYTHSISWAIHTKDAAKKAFRAKPRVKLMGDELDTLLRSCQDAQSVGIPIGPDLSLLIAEIILSRVDEVLQGHHIKGIRYIDDYELIFESEQHALKAKSLLQSALLEYELDLNDSKTHVRALPQELEDSWVGRLRSEKLMPHSSHFEKQVFRFFDHAFELAKKFPNEGVLKYAAGRVARMSIDDKKHGELVEHLLIQCAQVEPGALAVVLGSILKRPKVSVELNKTRARMLLRIITDASSQRHTSEASWALWACLVLGVELTRDAVQSVVSMDDSVCALLALHAKEKGLVKEPKDLAPLRDDLSAAALYSPKWMLAYESVRKGWFRFTGKRDYISKDPNFSKLRDAGVAFYDRQKASIPDGLIGRKRAHYVDDYVSGIAETDYDSEDDFWDDDPWEELEDEPDGELLE